MPRRNRFYLFVIGFILTISLAACSPTQLSLALTAANTFLKAINTYEESRVSASKQIEQSTQKIGSTVNEINADGIELEGAAKVSEEEWIKIHNNVDDLESAFNAIAPKSNEYFDVLRRNTNLINNPNIKSKEEQRVRETRQAWQKQLGEAEGHLERLEQPLKDLDDLYRVMINITIISKVDENIDGLEDVSSQAQNVLKDLEGLTIEGRKLTSG